ncbi:MAG: type II toxin-antitoxin system Phd/YefM family antitoxin [Actinomycetia bacterium]|nr:type II toxin-antitoxin system Phd/YefM family antitoxin [Actinomycetes bacterium]
MPTYRIAEAKAHFSEVLKLVANGETVAITRGKKREVVACIAPPEKLANRPKRKLGVIEHWGEITFADDWKMSDTELLGP